MSAGHFRWVSRHRRVLIDSHDLRFGVFYVNGPYGSQVYLHLPCVVIALKDETR